MSHTDSIRWKHIKETTKRILKNTPKQEKTLYTVDFKNKEYQTTDCSNLENILQFKEARKRKK